MFGSIDDPTYEACVDCVAWIANGQTPEHMTEEETDAWKDAVSGSAGDGHYWAYACPDDCEGWFSMSRCDVCRSPLGGDRHPVALMAVAS